MNNALKAKLIKRLKNAFSHQFNAETLRTVLVDTRTLLELVGETDRYKILKFHCDWILHPTLSNKRAQAVIKAIDDEFAKSVKKLGLQDWPDEIGSDFFGPVSQEFMNELLSRFTFHHFEGELSNFLDRHNIIKLADPASGSYRGFEVLYCQLIEDRTWEYTNKQKATRYINRVNVQMQQRPDAPTAPDEKFFPYTLSWTFLWNEEKRLKLTVEFLSKGKK